jgi:hypothetical protein
MTDTPYPPDSLPQYLADGLPKQDIAQWTSARTLMS